MLGIFLGQVVVDLLGVDQDAGAARR